MANASHDRLEGAPLSNFREPIARMHDEEDLPGQFVSLHMRKVARAVARAFLHGESSAGELQARGVKALGRKWPWLKPLSRATLEEFGAPLRTDQHDKLVQWILDFPAFELAFESATPPQIRAWFTFHPIMAQPPTALARTLKGALPELHTLGDLASWLQVTPGELDWFADAGGWGSKSAAPKLQHYDCHWHAKARGGWRLIEAPKSRLLVIQRKILHGLLDLIPAHDAAHGCVPGRSIASNAALHVGSQTLLRLDLRDFFTSIQASRVHALFRTLGYTVEVSRYLTGLTTHCVSHAVLRTMPTGEYDSVQAARDARLDARKYLQRHLPQGAPTSPALANLCAYRLDLRLAGAAAECGARYSRYVDDLVMSCSTPSPAHARRIALMAYTIILEEGFAPNVRKTQIMSRSQAQRVTGLVVNDKVNVPRQDYDRLKAILTNCVRHGPATQNRDAHVDFRAHLLGCLSHVQQISPLRGQRLRMLFDRIEWKDGSPVHAGI